MKLSELKRFALDMLFPPRCFGCGAYGAYVCSTCAATLLQAGFICPACGEQSFTGERHITCGAARYHLDGLAYVFRYDGVLRKAIQGVKYQRIFDAVPELAARAFRVMEADWLRYERFISFARTADAVTYVPMRTFAERRRGFNQARLFAVEIGKHFGIPVADVFRKTRNIPSQTTFEDATARRRNVRGAFALKRAVPRKLLIVDDVWTTGATLRACARAARAHGAEEIWGFTLAGAV